MISFNLAGWVYRAVNHPDGIKLKRHSMGQAELHKNHESKERAPLAVILRSETRLRWKLHRAGDVEFSQIEQDFA